MEDSTRSDIAKPIVETEKYNKMKTPSKVTGKAKEKIFSVGVDLVIIPIDTFIIRRAIEIGSIIMVAAKNIEPAAPIPDLRIMSNVGREVIGMNS